MAKTSDRLNEMSNQLGAMQETLKRIETHYLKQLEAAPPKSLVVAGSRGSVPEVKNRKLTEAEADKFVAAIGGQFSQLFSNSPFSTRSVSFEAEVTGEEEK